MAYTYEINPRPAALGGGWQIRLLDEGEEVGGGVFPVVVEEVAGIVWWNGLNDAERARWLQQSEGLGTAANAYVAYLRAQAYSDAEETAVEWLNSRN